MQTVAQQWIITSGVAALTAGLFIFDLHTPLGVANHILYLGPVLLSLLSPQPWLPVVTSGTATTLILIAGLLNDNPHNVPLWVPISNRAFSMSALWMPLWYFNQRRKHERQLQQLNNDLEQRVKDRTQQLASVNEALVAEVAERMRTERFLEASRQELKHLASQLIRVQEDERRRISRDLHDDINQRLAVLAIELERLGQPGASPQANQTQTLQSLADRVAEISEDVRRLAYEYHPSILDDLGLSIALQRLVDELGAHNHIAAHLVCGDLPPVLPQNIATCIYRVAQESLKNVVRHANASRVELELGRSHMGVTLTVTDNGVGFPLDQTRGHTGGLGFISMKERVALIGGALTIDSAIGKGTRVHATIPLLEEHP